MTLLDSLEWVAERLVCVYGESPNFDFVLGLRAHASRLREELERAEERSRLPHSRGRTKALVERINGGPLAATRGRGT